MFASILYRCFKCVGYDATTNRHVKLTGPVASNSSKAATVLGYDCDKERHGKAPGKSGSGGHDTQEMNCNYMPHGFAKRTIGSSYTIKSGYGKADDDT